MLTDISLKDIGLDTFQNPLFLRLLGNSAVFLFSVIQFRSFFTKTEGELDEYLNFINKSARVQMVINFCKRFLILHSQKFTAVTIFIVALSPISAINFVYLLLVLALLPFTNGVDTAGFFLMTYSMVRIVLIERSRDTNVSVLDLAVGANDLPVPRSSVHCQHTAHGVDWSLLAPVYILSRSGKL